MGVDHLGQAGLQQQIHELWRAVRRISKATLQNSSIGRAVLRFYEGGRILIEGGGGVEIRDSGYIIIDGDLTGAGDFDWTGPLKARGPWQLIGLGTVTATTTNWLGDINMSGDMNLTGDIAVKSGGRIVVEGGSTITLEQSGGVAHMLMGSSEIRGGDGGVGIYPGSGPAIISTAAGLRITSLPTITSSSAGLPPGALHIDGLGFVRQVV